MKILAIDTSTRMGSVALFQGKELIAELQLNIEVTHTEKLLPAIDSLLKQAGWELSHLQGLALSIGPGSFTGLRIGLATLKGFALGHNLPLVGVSSLLALAHNGALSEKPVAALLDAKRGEVYAGVYQFRDGNLEKIIIEEQAIKPDQLCNTLVNLGGCWLLGDGAKAYQELFRSELGKKAFFPPSPLMHLQARWVALLALPLLEKGEGKEWQSLVPNYLRVSDAERIVRKCVSA